jgi:phage baseplate assembly protein gpV
VKELQKQETKCFQNKTDKYLVTWDDGTTNEYELQLHHIMNLKMCSIVKCVEKKFSE